MMRNKSPKIFRSWDSRFTECAGERHYRASRINYLAKVRPDLETESIRLQVSKDKTISTVTDSQRLYDEINKDVLKNGTRDEKFELVKTLYAKLAELEAEKMAANARLESHHSEMEEKLSGRKDSEHMELIRTIGRVTKRNQASKADFIGELKERFDTQANNW